MTNEQTLYATWDRIFNHLTEFDFSHISKVFIDTINLAHDAFACHYEGTIVVDPRVFSYRGVWKSNYTSHIIQESDLLLYLLTHEIYHYLYRSNQIDITHATQMEEEIAADNFAALHLKAMK